MTKGVGNRPESRKASPKLPGKKELAFIRNGKALSEAGSKSETVELDILADSTLTGAMVLECYRLEAANAAPARQDTVRRVKLIIKKFDDSIELHGERVVTVGGEFSPTRIGTEIVALATLFLRRRLTFAGLGPWGTLPAFQMKAAHQSVDPGAVGGVTDLGVLARWFDLVSTLTPKEQVRLLLAARIYQRALRVIEGNPDMAYIDLVTAVETISSGFDVARPTPQDEEPAFVEMVERVAEAGLRASMMKELGKIVGRRPFLKRRFREFVCDHIPAEFWTLSNRPRKGYGRVVRRELPGLLGRIYDQRSRTLHDAEPFPMYAVRPELHRAELDFGQVIYDIEGGAKWQPDEYLPHVAFFERIVRVAMLSWLMRNSGPRPACAPAPRW